MSKLSAFNYFGMRFLSTDSEKTKKKIHAQHKTQETKANQKASYRDLKLDITSLYGQNHLISDVLSKQIS